MGIADDISGADGWQAGLAALAWQADLGATEAIGDVPLCRYDLPDQVKPPPVVVAAIPAALAPVTDRTYVAPPSGPGSEDLEAAIMAARHAAHAATTLAALRTALQDYPHCDLKRGARNLVFADGNPAARVMIITDAPDVVEDREGRPFCGPSGVLLDRMFAAIGLSRPATDGDSALYVTAALPWRTPQDSDPSDADLAKMRPFVERHITLINPDVVVLMGNTPLRTLLTTAGILRHRGEWGEVAGKPALPMVHPSHLLRNPAAKREAWADLLALQARLRQMRAPYS